MKANANKGFTLIELLVVIAIIGLLATVVMTSLNSARKKGRDTRRVEDINQIKTALELYYDSNSQYPDALDDLASGTPRFLSVVPTDPTNSGDYVYSYAASTDNLDYVLKANLETQHKALNSDVDGTYLSVTCDDGTTAPFAYCVRP